MKHDWIRPDWPAPANVRALSTTRSGGISTGPWQSFNLGTRCGDDPAHVGVNRSRLDSLLPSPVQWLHQVHGTRVVRVKDQVTGEPRADAQVCFEPGGVCAVLTADCLPVLFCNRSGSRVGVAHAGWRGLASGVLEATIAALDEEASQLLAWLGPAIGPKTYEVGQDVASAFEGEFPAGFEPRGGRYLLDLYTLARIKLATCGVRAVHGGGFCTFSDSERFFSYRRDGVTGRMASLIWLREG